MSTDRPAENYRESAPMSDADAVLDLHTKTLLSSEDKSYIYEVIEILRTVDADTIDCRISLGFGLKAAFRFRLAFIDAYEIYGTNASQKGQEAAEFASNWLGSQDNLVVITFRGSQETVGIGDGAFGRWLGHFVNTETDESLAGQLLELGYAVRSDY